MILSTLELAPVAIQIVSRVRNCTLNTRQMQLCQKSQLSSLAILLCRSLTRSVMSSHRSTHSLLLLEYLALLIS